MKRLSSGLWLAGLLAGCIHAPARDPATTAPPSPPRWTATENTSAALPAHWLAEFGDRRLTAWVQEALRGNNDLQATAARVHAAQAEARIAGAGRWPQLAFAPGYQRAQVRDAGYGSSQFGAFEALFVLDWEIDIWGRIAAQRESAGRTALATDLDWRAARLSLAARATQLYFELSEARLQVTVAEHSLRDRRTIAELVRGRFNRGLTPGLDLRLALTDLADAEAQLAAARNRTQSLARQLETLMGRYPAADLDPINSLPEPPPALPVGLPAELLTRRPDLSAAFERLRAADLDVESARKARLPRITLTAGGGTRSAALTELVDPRAVAWNVFIGLAQPVFTGGRLAGQVRLDQARAQEALYHYRDAALRAFREVEQALAAEEHLRHQEAALREAVRQTEASRRLAIYSYRNGTIEILTLLDSYRGAFSAQSAHLAVQRQLLTNRVDLYLALGGDA